MLIRAVKEFQFRKSITINVVKVLRTLLHGTDIEIMLSYKTTLGKFITAYLVLTSVIISTRKFVLAYEHMRYAFIESL